MFPDSKCRSLSSALILSALVGLSACSDEVSDQEPSAVVKAAEQGQIIELANFDGGLPAWINADEAEIESVASHVASGGEALGITFLPNADTSMVVLKPDQPWDLSAESDFHIAIDVENIGEESVQLYLGVTDSTGAAEGVQVLGNSQFTSNRSASVPGKQSGTYYAVLDGPSLKVDTGLRQSPPPWQSEAEMMVWRFGNRDINFKQITAVTLFVRGNLTTKKIAVDNIRILRNPQSDEQSLKGFVDRYGQNAKLEYPIKVDSDAALKKAADEELAKLAKSSPMLDRSRFGGWKDGPQLEATGFYRTAKVDGQWWMVDPEGYLFFSHGLANVRMANLFTLTGIDFKDASVRAVDSSEVTPEDSIGIVPVSDQARKSQYIASTMRRDMFNWLPQYDDELAEHYSYRRSVHSGPVESGETYSFYRANLERRYGQTSPDSYIKQWQQTTLDRMLDWGFTSMGNWVDPAFYPNERVPYFANGWVIGDFKTLSSKSDVWSPMPDAFDPEFVRRAKITVDVVASEIKSSPWCVGVFIDNEKSWGFREGSVEKRFGLILDALSKSAEDSPAKARFSEHLKSAYGDIETVNERWNTHISSWHALEQGVEFSDYTASLEADMSDMLAMLSNEYFKVVHDAVAAALPNHLYMGARMASWGMPDETIEAAVKYSDVLSFNIYKEGVRPQAWAFLKDIDLPSIIGEFHIGATSDTGLYHHGLVQASDQQDRAKMYTAYMDSVIAHPNMVGAHWFQYVDSPLTGRAFDGESYNVGFVSVTDIPYPEMVDAARQFNRKLYGVRSSLAEPDSN